MRITPFLLLHWLLATAVMVLAICYIGGEVIGWENLRLLGGRRGLYGAASKTLLVVVAGWLLITFCSYAAARDGEFPLEGVLLAGVGWALMLMTPLGIYVSRL